MIEHRGQTLVRELPAALPAMGDSDARQHLVISLLVNAPYHTGPGTRVALMSDRIRVALMCAMRGRGSRWKSPRASSNPCTDLAPTQWARGWGSWWRGALLSSLGRLWYDPVPGWIFHLALFGAPN